MDAKRAVLDAGFAYEVDWQEDLRLSDVTESKFLEEHAWVVFSSGFREAVLREKFPDLRLAFAEFASGGNIWSDRIRCQREALRIFNHPGKVRAVLECSRLVYECGFEVVRSQVMRFGVEFLQELPYLGPVTSLHLAKNIGLDVVKPDRHLVRIAEQSGYHTPLELCAAIQEIVGDALCVIDLVIWRYATIEPGAGNKFSAAR